MEPAWSNSGEQMSRSQFREGPGGEGEGQWLIRMPAVKA